MSASQTLSLRIPGGGPLTAELIQLVNEFCDQAEDVTGDTVAIVHLGPDEPTGAHWPGDISIHLVNRWERALRRVERLSAVTVAAATGHCASPALEVLLATDYRLAAADTEFALPTTAGQLWPGMVLHRLANQVGVARTRQLLLFSPTITAAGAGALGLVDEMTEDLPAAVRRAVAALEMVEGSEFAIRRRLLLDAPTTSFEDALGVHLAASDRALRHPARPQPVAGR